jgi:hypothetical protein
MEVEELVQDTGAAKGSGELGPGSEDSNSGFPNLTFAPGGHEFGENSVSYDTFIPFHLPYGK